MTFIPTRERRSRWLAAVVACLAASPLACKGGAAGSGAADAGGADAGSVAGPDAATAMASMLLQAPEARQIGTLALDEPLADVVELAGLALGLHATHGVSLLDLSDPTAPGVSSRLDTTGPAVGVAYDAEQRVLFVITTSGDLRAYRVADPTAPVQAAQTTIAEPGESGDTIAGLARVGSRLFALGQANLLPISIEHGADGSLDFRAQDAVPLDARPQWLAAGGDALYVAFKDGKVQVFSSGDAPSMRDQTNLGADVAGWVVRGNRLLVALKGLGLRVVDMTVVGQAKVVFDAPGFDDPTALKRFGTLALVSLSRGLLVALDLSSLQAPRPLVTRSGAVPDWIAPLGGNLLLGSGKQLDVLGVPPFVSATLPKLSRDALPRYARIPLQLSKPVDPASVSVDHVKLSCGGSAVEGTVSVGLDGMRITFLPKADLPAGVGCSLALSGIKDVLGLDLSVPQAAPALAFSTMTQAPAAIDNPKSGYAHTADGQFTDWQKGKSQDFEYFDVKPARGMYSYFYADHDGTRLWLLNDWFYDGDGIAPECYNQFGVWTGGGSQRWDIRAYGDQHVEVRLNGALLPADDKRVHGGYGRGPSPNLDEPHTIYEIAIQTAPGTWGVQLHDPGPTFGCEQLETDPITYEAMSTSSGSSIDPTSPPAAPAKPQQSALQGVVGATPTLAWTTTDAPGNFTVYLVEISSGSDLGQIIYRVWAYGPAFTLPLGLLQSGTTYTWRVTAYNLAGSAQGDPATFTVGQPAIQSAGAPKLDSVTPSSVTQSTTQGLTISGSGFVQGATAYFAGTALNTTFVSSTELMAMLDPANDGSTGTFALTVRNLPSDPATESNALQVTVQATPSTCSHPECIPGGALAGDCSACATEVCGGHANCCSAGWDPGCVNAAAGSQTCGCSPPSLSEVAPTTLAASTATTLTATLANAPAGQAYTLVLTGGGGSGDGGPTTGSFPCTATTADSCSASVSLPAGTYDVKIVVGTTPTLDTNTLSSALTISPATACVHAECGAGAALQAGCSSCVTGVCTSTPACCSSNWGLDCVLVAYGLQACSCTQPSLTSGALSVTSQNAGDSTPLSVAISDALIGASYELWLSPNGDGGTGGSFPCTLNGGGTACDATVSGLTGAGSYDARLHITSGAEGYDSNVLANAFTVNAAAGCAHSECLPGAALATGCSACVTTICNNTASCCSGSWDATCVGLAPTLGMCGCSTPALTSLGPSGQNAADSTAVTATMSNAPSGATYQLVLTPVGGGNESLFDCVYNPQPGNTCTATVSGLAASTAYNAAIRVGTTPSYDTNTLDSGFMVN